MKPSERLIQTIKEQRISPLPRWLFRLRNGAVWSIFIFAIVLGALAFSVILFSIQQADFSVLTHLSHSRLELFLGLLPFFWIVLLTAFLLIAIFSIQHSNRGYKFTIAKVTGFSVVMSLLLGTIFFVSGGAHRLEHAFEVNLFRYKGVQEKKARIWTMPKEGYLCGDITKVNKTTFHLHDFESRIWTIRYDSAYIHGPVFLEKGETIKLIGKMTEDNHFTATEIRPWGGPGGPGNRPWLRNGQGSR